VKPGAFFDRNDPRRAIRSGHDGRLIECAPLIVEDATRWPLRCLARRASLGGYPDISGSTSRGPAGCHASPIAVRCARLLRLEHSISGKTSNQGREGQFQVETAGQARGVETAGWRQGLSSKLNLHGWCIEFCCSDPRICAANGDAWRWAGNRATPCSGERVEVVRFVMSVNSRAFSFVLSLEVSSHRARGQRKCQSRCGIHTWLDCLTHEDRIMGREPDHGTCTFIALPECVAGRTMSDMRTVGVGSAHGNDKLTPSSDVPDFRREVEA